MRFQFRFRSTQHDAGFDRARLTRIHQTVRSAVKDAERELNGLRARLEEARQSAALLLANMESGDRDQSHDFKLKSVEERLLAAEKRIRELKDHLVALQRIESAIDLELNSGNYAVP